MKINKISSHIKWDNLIIDTYENWVKLSRNSRVPIWFIHAYQNKLIWSDISTTYRHFSKKFIREFADKIDWSLFCLNNCDSLTDDLIREFKDKVEWIYISREYNITVDFVKEFYKELDWTEICWHRDLTEKFMETFKRYINWRLIFDVSKTFRNIY